MKYNDNGTYKDIYVKAFDTLPIGAELDYDGNSVPDGWTEVADPNTYSTDEVRIGTWKDNKPLYRKIVETTLPNAITDGTFVYSDYIIGTTYQLTFIEWGYFVNSGSIITIPYSNNSGFTAKAFMNDAGTIRIFNSNTSWNGSNITISILYTKTTD